MRKWLWLPAAMAMLGAAMGCEADKPDTVVVADLRKPLGPKNDVAVRLEEMPAGKPSLAYQESSNMPVLGALPVIGVKPRTSVCEVEGKPGGAWAFSIGRAPVEGPLVTTPVDDGYIVADPDQLSSRDGDWGYGVVQGDAARARADEAARARASASATSSSAPAQPGMTVNVIVTDRTGAGGTTVPPGPGAPGVVVGSVNGEAVGFSEPRSETATGADSDLRQREGSVVGTGAGQGGPTGFGRNTVGADWDDARVAPAAPRPSPSPGTGPTGTVGNNTGATVGTSPAGR